MPLYSSLFQRSVPSLFGTVVLLLPTWVIINPDLHKEKLSPTDFSRRYFFLERRGLFSRRFAITYDFGLPRYNLTYFLMRKVILHLDIIDQSGQMILDAILRVDKNIWIVSPF